MEPSVWWCVGSLFPDNKYGTYKCYEYSKMPKIEISDKFAKYKSINDINDNFDELNETLNSPTACYFEVTKLNSGDNIFMRDQQDCLLWALHNDGFVYIYEGEDEGITNVVAGSLAEFLSRIYLENVLWYKTYMTKDKKLNEVEKKYIADFKELNKKIDVSM
jgi:hypothetical protein